MSSVNIFDFKDDLLQLNIVEAGTYIKLIFLCVELGGFIFLDEIEHLLKEIGKEHANNVNSVLNKHFYKAQSGWRHPYIDSVILDHIDTTHAH